jgi:hypothetical protein
MFLLQEETNSFLKAIEEANKKMQVAEISLEEKDQRIGELDRLIERMEKVTEMVSNRDGLGSLSGLVKTETPQYPFLSAPRL